MVSTSLGVARMILSGMLDRLPDLDVIVPHLGGTLPYLAQRFVDFGRGDANHDLPYYLRHRLYYDTCSHHAPAYRCFVDTVGHDRVMLGSDYPARGTLRRAVDFVTEVTSSPQERDAVLGGTASRWFRAASTAAARPRLAGGG
jgi:predicted TIM-barrel fold metal-dependent hydrolase